MLANYLNQTAAHRAKTGSDSRGQTTYANSVTIACRRRQKTQSVLTKDGQTFKTKNEYYTLVAVAEGDMIDGKTVMGVSVWTHLNGRILGYKAVL